MIRFIIFCMLFSEISFSKNSYSGAFEKGKQSYATGKYAMALDYFANAINSANSALERNLAFYYQGLTFFELGLYHSSFISFKNVLLSPDAKNKQVYEKAIKNSVIIADKLDIVPRIGKVIANVSPELIPSTVVDIAHYAIGMHYYNIGDVKSASSHLKSVHPKSRYYLKALFLLGVIATKEQNYNEAIFSFKKILQLTYGKKAYFSLSELARLNLARVLYASGQLESSIETYSKFLSSSPYWLNVLFEASWPLMRLNDTTVSLGNLHTILSPFYREDMVGEGYVLRATILFTLCKYEEMRRTLAQFFDIYETVLKEMHLEKSKLGNADAFYYAFMKKEGLNKAFLGYVNHDEGLKKKVKILEILQKERMQIATYRRNKEINRLQKLLDEAEKEVSSEIGTTLMKLHQRKLKDLLEQREQANYLKVEIVTGEKELIESHGLPPKRIVDVKTSVASGYEFWPFLGEYWEDELGAYVYTTESSCIN